MQPSAFRLQHALTSRTLPFEHKRTAHLTRILSLAATMWTSPRTTCSNGHSPPSQPAPPALSRAIPSGKFHARFFFTIRDMKQFLHHIEYSFAQRMISLQVQSCRRHACPCRPFDRFHAPKRSKPPAPPVQEKDASRDGMLLPLPFKVGVPIQRRRPASALPLAIHTVLEFVSRPSIPVVIFFTICHRTPSDPAAVDAAMI